MESLVESIKAFLLAQDLTKTLWVAYSGGLDSHVLLHLCAAVRTENPFSLKAIYIHHGLSPHASSWALHAKEQCAQLNIAFFQCNVTLLPKKGQSIEEEARNLRYQAIGNLLAPNDLVLTAHHEDDQAETMMLQLFRGAGVKGLASMPHKKPLGEGFLVRPLRHIRRSTLEAYAKAHALQWIEDESNFNPRYTRNFLRHQVFPLLNSRWPSITTTLARVANNCAETQDLLHEMALSDLATMTKEGARDILSLIPLKLLSPARQRLVLRTWLQRGNFPLPSTLKMADIQTQFFSSQPDKIPHVKWGGVELRRYHDHLYVMKCLKPIENKIYPWNGMDRLIFNQNSRLTCTLQEGKGLRIIPEGYTIRFRRGGEVCSLPGKSFRQQLKKLFQEWNVPPWLRSRIPLVFKEERLICVVGYFMDGQFLAEKHELGCFPKYIC